MIICTRCGAPNLDEARFCAKCRHKLQSSRKAVQTEDSSWQRLEKMTNRFSEKDRAELLRMAEACGYSLAVVAAVVFSTLYGDWRPLYAVIGVVALVAWIRKI
ncbi:zinc-ribbon domain-containing protein [Salidesulfovibrio onnuriiensis]|uniref:zinc-ribbon domain-containing protein n=1 Tax=Salidesulfovibrio onnuriiensis TaxID=2583823 RepID=UPI0016509572|nr:zinc ribbon domain-containing protein [Salidesulfovibrio onnuriiensis]